MIFKRFVQVFVQIPGLKFKNDFKNFAFLTFKIVKKSIVIWSVLYVKSEFLNSKFEAFIYTINIIALAFRIQSKGLHDHTFESSRTFWPGVVARTASLAAK